MSDTENPILQEMQRRASEGNAVKGIVPAEGNKPPSYRVEFRLADGSSASYYVEARNDREFHSWFDKAFQSLVKSVSPHRGQLIRTRAR